MKTFILIIFILLSIEAHAGIGQYQWQYRVVLAQAETEEQAQDWLKRAQTQQVALQERKLILQVVTPGTVLSYPESVKAMESGEINERLGRVSVLLIGLDGGNKGVYDTLDFDVVFQDIDQMPMRRAEMTRY
ncbi:DUF4174 domain-containing protein [Alteromonas gilva]|uniref:DUF4174 domain-containing protein n=1 Tax=Alteromonas gilva TaxID=2987522 RepID=A0ABT5L381_9ALTE|nr:DUF4174 domain-containing protein [Alteromonas gilva]MDC8830302.1 DUF4174 domain-containing protein [Alteromonas gilva]